MLILCLAHNLMLKLVTVTACSMFVSFLVVKLALLVDDESSDSKNSFTCTCVLLVEINFVLKSKRPMV